MEIRRGRIKPYYKNGELFHSAYLKEKVDQAVEVTVHGITGDEQADRSCHGGSDKALLHFPQVHYPRFSERSSAAISPGAFGENLLLENWEENDVCVGDVYRIGNLLLEVTQPRQPCWKIQKIVGKEVMQYAVKNQATGWYCRVLEEGKIYSGLTIEHVERKCDWSISQLTHFLHRPPEDQDITDALIGLPFLAQSYKDDLSKKVSSIH